MKAKKLISTLLSLLILVRIEQVVTKSCAKRFTVATDEDISVKIAVQNFHQKPAASILISKPPGFGSLDCFPDKTEVTHTDEYCSLEPFYLPALDYSGEDAFRYFLLHKNLTTISNEEYEVRIIIRPNSDNILAGKDEVTMQLSGGFIHIPVLENDQYVDKPYTCMNKNPGVHDKSTEIKFKDIAEELGMDAVQSAIPSSPDCLFDHYDPTLKTWIKGSFCLPEQSAGAGATADYDNDGLLDIYYARVDGNDQLWRNLGDGSFQLVTAEANLTQTMNHRSTSVTWADVDNDGDVDLYIGTMAENRFYFYVNDGMGHFTEEAIERGLAGKPTIPPFKTSTMTIAIGDYNKDGWLDFYSTEWLPHLDQSYDYKSSNHSLSRLLKNLGGEGKPGYFADVTFEAGLGTKPEPRTRADERAGLTNLTPYRIKNIGLFKDVMPGPYSLSAMFTDIDADGNLDLAVSGDFFTSRLYWGTENGTFMDGTNEAGVGLDENGMGSTIADFNNDGRQDWFVTSIYMSEEYRNPYIQAYGEGGGMIFGYTGNRMYKYEGDRKFTDETDNAGVRPGWWGWGTAFFDYDNDGDLDLIHTNGFDDSESTDFDFLHHTATFLYENHNAESGNSNFTSVGDSKGVTDRRDGRGLFVFDYDNDGDQDVYIVSNCEKPVFYRNDGGHTKDWIRVNVYEANSDRESIGAWVYLYSPKFGRDVVREIRSSSAFSGQGENTAHYGLAYETADYFTVRVYWPVTNDTHIIENVPRRTVLHVRDFRGKRNFIHTTSSPEESLTECRKMKVALINREPNHGKVLHYHNYVTYYPAPGFSGEDSFEYIVTDGVTSSVGQVKVKVENSNVQKQSEASDPSSLQTWATFSGYANNLDDLDLGRALCPLMRIASPAYDDGFQTPAGKHRPNPRNISNVLGNQKTDIFSLTGLNQMHIHFGQLLAHDIDFSTPYANSLPTENFAIKIPTGDPWFDPYSTGTQTMRLRRSAHAANTGKHNGVPREQVNKVSSFIDLSVIYGSDKDRASVLRSGVNGKLLDQSEHNLPFNTKQLPNLNLLGGPREKLLLSGDPRVNVQPGLICLHTIWAREHNLICDELKKLQALERYDDETLFQHARTITRAKWQAIVWYEFLPTAIGKEAFKKIPEYQGYNSSLKVGVFNEFATAAFRYGHSQIDNTMLRLNDNWNILPNAGNLELRDAYFNPGRVVTETGIEPLLRGMLQQKAQNVDTFFVDAVRNFLFGTNTQGLDLMSYGIQRGRDHGLADYNSVRKALNLEPRTSFDQITSDEIQQKKLESLYVDINNVDLWIGGLAEPHLPGGCVGETFAAIIVKQFQLLRDGDRFWFENPYLEPTKDRMAKYRDTKLADILRRNTVPVIEWSKKTFFTDIDS